MSTVEKTDSTPSDDATQTTKPRLTFNGALGILASGVVILTALVGGLAVLIAPTLKGCSGCSGDKSAAGMNFVHQGNIPKVAIDPVAIDEIRRTYRLVEQRDVDFAVTTPFFAGSIMVRKGQIVITEFSGEETQWLRDRYCSKHREWHRHEHVGPNGGRLPSLVDEYPSSFLCAAAPVGGIVGVCAASLQRSKENVPFPKGKHPDPFFIGKGPIAVWVPEDGLFAWSMNDHWRVGSWMDNCPTDDDGNPLGPGVTWHARVSVYSRGKGP